MPMREMIWAQFLAELEPYGVSVATTTTGKRYLFREHDGQEWVIAFPGNFHPDRRVTPYVLDVFCRALAIDPRDFSDDPPFGRS